MGSSPFALAALEVTSSEAEAAFTWVQFIAIDSGTERATGRSPFETRRFENAVSPSASA